MDRIDLEKIDEVWMRVHCGQAVERELTSAFKFRPVGFQFMPAYKDKRWDGYIKMFDWKEKKMLIGLAGAVENFARVRNYELDDNGILNKKKADPKLRKSIVDFINNSDIRTSKGERIVPRDYQIESVVRTIMNRKLTIVSSTGSGKSLIIYLVIRWYQEELERQGKHVLLIVPTVSLVSQMKSDFAEYSCKDKTWDNDAQVQTISGGKGKDKERLVVISTWQSVYKVPKKWFKPIGLTIGDEVHKFQKAQCLQQLMEKTSESKYKLGLTGTLGEDCPISKLTIEGLFGKIYQATRTKQLMDEGSLSPIKIVCPIFSYSKADKEAAYKLPYKEEIDFILQHPERLLYTTKMIDAVKGNNLVLYRYVEAHGKLIYEALKKISDRPVFFISGGSSDREEIRKAMIESKNAILVASIGTTSTGVNIPNIDNVFFVSPSKSQIQILQSIGRGLRKSAGKERMVLYDFVDDLSYTGKRGAKHFNYSLKHFLYRVKIYDEEEFPYRPMKINFKESTPATLV